MTVQVKRHKLFMKRILKALSQTRQDTPAATLHDVLQ
jgi:hypothetical protein